MELSLLPAVALGGAVAFLYFLSLALRLWRLTPGASKGQMLWGLLLRFLLIFFSFGTAAYISPRIFAAAALGFIISYALILIILCRREKN